MKQMMLAFGMPYDATKDRPTNRGDQVHANGVWARFDSYRSGHAQGTGYSLPAGNPFDDWDVSDRYANQSNFDQTRAQTHRAGTKVVCDLIKKAQLEGLLM
ncbi:hypothetical protein BI364_10615 [Acidihalobacter yilgarnensis]|uniref:Uncharacterized protein n=1 Tax=Acidihalobacter yilgarnensis TaxID=2819280 RepID=A0A1D8IT20_9GAMM|nr:hypothetical protein BI364_10615 [Acidihalobacter yilgarnensis]